MAEQNLISAEISPDKVNDLINKIRAIKEELNFLVKLNAEEKNNLLKLGDRLLPFVDKAKEILDMYPQIMSPLFNADEFRRDYNLMKNLTPMLNELNSLREALDDTIFATGSDCFTSALEIYSAVQMNRDKIPGMDTIYQEMRNFFNRPKRKQPQNPQS
jgi:hypothetical protein